MEIVTSGVSDIPAGIRASIASTIDFAFTGELCEGATDLGNARSRVRSSVSSMAWPARRRRRSI
jgi:hypothetical protein